MQCEVQRQDRGTEYRVATCLRRKDEIPVRAWCHEEHHQPKLHIDVLTKEKKSQSIGKNGCPQEIDCGGGQCEADILERRTQLTAVCGEKNNVEQRHECRRDDMRGDLAEWCHIFEADSCQCCCDDEERLIYCSKIHPFTSSVRT